MCFPRILGYVFNPLSIIYCYNEDNLISIFYEVKNTSNEQHTYFFASKEIKNKEEYKHQCNKSFYVSPFIEMKGVYKFTNSISEEKLSIIIDLFNDKNEKNMSNINTYVAHTGKTLNIKYHYTKKHKAILDSME